MNCVRLLRVSRSQGMNALLAALVPLVHVGGPLTSWVVSLLMIALFVTAVVWIVSRFLGPPDVPSPARPWLWLIVGIALLIFVFAALGIALP